MLEELIENGIEAEKRKRQEFFELAELCRNATDQRKPSVATTNWAEWSLATDAQDRALASI